MAILIGTVYVWALYGVVLALGGLHVDFRPFWVFDLFWGSFGVAFSLGLARLAQRHSGKQLALAPIVLNPGYAWLPFAIKSIPNDPSGESRGLVPAMALLGIGFGVLATFLSLGLVSGWLPGTRQKTLGAVACGLWTVFGVSAVWSVWRPSPFESYILLPLSLAGLIWALSFEDTRARENLK